MLNHDLDRLAQWLYEHKLTLNVSKSKFMLIGGPRKLNTLEEFTLTTKEKELDRVNSYRYLGVIINENLSWTDRSRGLHHARTKCLRGLAFYRE